MQDILLSIYIPTYNRADKVVKQINYVLDEIKGLDTSKIEIVVNNNCSTDDTEQKVLSVIEGMPVTYHRNESNLGIVGNAYAAVKLVHGKYFWMISDDDEICTGAIRRVYELINSNPKISYVYLNYSNMINIEEPIYDGPSGLIENGAKLIINQKVDKIGVLMLSTSSIYLKEGLEKTVRDLPLSECESYGWSEYAALASIKMGFAYFDGQIWVHMDAQNKSWKNIEYYARMGSIRMFERLTNIGYTKSDIAIIYNSYISVNIIAEQIIWLLKEKKFKMFLSNFFFCFRKAPVKVICICFSLLFKCFTLLLKKLKI
ncbi:MAG: glycosyltransferase family 2 protein [Lachnospiraceae bacterium]|nr:glycosyltransferase family 2 protein [Lachnospiraceae bacterium]